MYSINTLDTAVQCMVHMAVILRCLAGRELELVPPLYWLYYRENEQAYWYGPYQPACAFSRHETSPTGSVPGLELPLLGLAGTCATTVVQL